MSNSLLVLGPRYSKKDSIGGVVVLFELFIAELEKRSIQYICIDTNKSNYSNSLIAYVMIFWVFLKNVGGATHVSLHGTASAYKYIAPIVVFFAKAFNKKVSLRKFAGSFIEVYEGSSWISRFFIRFSLSNANHCAFETKYLVDYFKKFNPSTYWFPNVRMRPSLPKKTKEFNKSFIFVGQVKETKGVLDLIEAFEKMPSDYSLDLYGPIEITNFHEIIKSCTNVSYKGSLLPADVASTMASYDIFIMPTFHPGEGYPGVIIEAFSVGLPVISTNLSGIKEIVFDGKSGILVEPRNVNQLVEAIAYFNSINYSEFAFCAQKAFEQFDSAEVTKDWLTKIGL